MERNLHMLEHGGLEGGNRVGWSKHPEWQQPAHKHRDRGRAGEEVQGEIKRANIALSRAHDRLVDALLYREVIQETPTGLKCGACGASLPCTGPSDLKAIIEHVKGCKFCPNIRERVKQFSGTKYSLRLKHRRPLETIVVGDAPKGNGGNGAHAGFSAYLRMMAEALGVYGRVVVVGWKPWVSILVENFKRSLDSIPVSVQTEDPNGFGTSVAVTIELAAEKQPEPKEQSTGVKLVGSAKKQEPATKAEPKESSRKQEPAEREAKELAPEPFSISQLSKGEVEDGRYKYGAFHIAVKSERAPQVLPQALPEQVPPSQV
jgi:hypothetical protein